ncbi:MAG: permease [Elusimicrobiota bacterium]
MAIDPICGMNVDEKNGNSITYKDKSYYFCSQQCLEKFKKGNNITDADNVCVSCGGAKKRLFGNTIFLMSVLIITLIILSYFFPFFEPFRRSFRMYTRTIWWAILLGLVLGGLIDYYVPREYVSKVLAAGKKRSIIYAVVLGFLMSACSHGILALTIQLYKKGAAIPAVISFLLASPWANFPLTIMLIGFFGITNALFIIISAVVVAIITGFVFLMLDKARLIESNANHVNVAEDFSIISDIKQRWKSYKFSASGLRKDVKGVLAGGISLAKMVMGWMLIGMTLAGLAAAYVPQNIFRSYMGPSTLGLLITIILATILEVCSEGTAPLAFEIFRQTGALGNSFVFLMAGVVTDYTEIGLLWSNIGRKTALWLPAVTVPQVILLGILANTFF